MYLKTANKIFSKYDKIYKANQKQAVNTAKRTKKSGSGLTGLGIAYCIGSGIYGFMKGCTKE